MPLFYPIGVQGMYLSKWNNHIPIKVFKLLVIVGDLAAGVVIKCSVADISI